VFLQFRPVIFPAGIAAAKGACANQSMTRSKHIQLAGGGLEAELRHGAGRTGWLKQAQLKHTMKKL